MPRSAPWSRTLPGLAPEPRSDRSARPAAPPAGPARGGDRARRGVRGWMRTQACSGPRPVCIAGPSPRRRNKSLSQTSCKASCTKSGSRSMRANGPPLPRPSSRSRNARSASGCAMGRTRSKDTDQPPHAAPSALLFAASSCVQVRTKRARSRVARAATLRCPSRNICRTASSPTMTLDLCRTTIVNPAR